MSRTFCNPIPLPNYPRGRCSTAQYRSQGGGWLTPEKRDFRETADPTVIYDSLRSRWILYPSAGMAYVSTDLVTWQHHPITPADCGYAPTVAQVGQQWWLTASRAPILVSDDPLGPFVPAGAVVQPDGSPLTGEMQWLDPMIFVDDDGRVYGYWGLRNGIFGAEMDSKHPGRLLTKPQRFITYNSQHEWERGGWFNQFDTSCPEGSWMHKARGRYWLTYSAPGTNPMYSMGAYVGDAPLGPFTYAVKNPIIDGRGGRFVQGAGHGSIVAGPRGTLWAFFTCHIQNEHGFERRIGMAAAGFDQNGNLVAARPSDTPQWAPGVAADPLSDGDTGWLPVSMGESLRASSSAPGRTPRYAVDLNPHTWWQSSEDDPLPWLEIDLFMAQDLRSMRIHWREPGLEYDAGVVPIPMRWRLMVRTDAQQPWRTIVDRSKSTDEMLIVYETFPANTNARCVRLELTEHPGRLGVGLTDWTIFAATPNYSASEKKHGTT